MVLGRAARRLDGRSLGGEVLRQRRELRREQGRDPVAQPDGERRARTVRAHGHAHGSLAGDGGEDEATLGGQVGGVDPDAVGTRGGRDGGIDRLDPGGGDDEPHPVEVVGLEGALPEVGEPVPIELLVEVRGDDANGGAGGDETGDLPDRDGSGTDDEDRYTVQVEHDGVAERHVVGAHHSRMTRRSDGDDRGNVRTNENWGNSPKT